LVLNAIGARLDQSAIVSTKAARKQLDGQFSLVNPAETLETVTKKLGLVWYADGQSLYVYDASETRTAVGHLNRANVGMLKQFLAKAHLLDDRFPLRGDVGESTFYVSGPPVYVDLVLSAAAYVDDIYRSGPTATTTTVEVIPVRHGFVSARQSDVRGERIAMSSLVDVLSQLLGSGTPQDTQVTAPPPRSFGQDGDDGATSPEVAVAPATRTVSPQAPTLTGQGSFAGLTVVAYPQMNSLIVKGTAPQVEQVKRLVAALDVAHEQIELSLWIIDVDKRRIDQLGVNWSGSQRVGKLTATLNQQAGDSATLSGNRFLAQVNALIKDGDAAVISRPVVLTQENELALFDDNHTFYQPLVGERVTSLQSVTYGTMIRVLPRLAGDGQIEMQLKIEDGTAGPSTPAGGIPNVARTSIETVARVPPQMSLLVGGYTRSSTDSSVSRLPGLSRIPVLGGLFRNRSNVNQQVVRLYLIQPRVLANRAGLNSEQMQKQLPDDAQGPYATLPETPIMDRPRPVDPMNAAPDPRR
jgi:type III secretion protein C